MPMSGPFPMVMQYAPFNGTDVKEVKRIIVGAASIGKMAAFCTKGALCSL